MKSISTWICFSLMTLGCCLTPLRVNARTMPGEAGDFGAGGIVGSPTGLSAKYWLNSRDAFDAAVAWHFGHVDQLQLHSDYLYHYTVPNLSTRGRLPLYFGGGLRVLAGDDSSAGIRFPLGASFLFPEAPVEVFAEIAPVLEFAPDTEGSLDGGVGVRFYFRPGL